MVILRLSIVGLLWWNHFEAAYSLSLRSPALLSSTLTRINGETKVNGDSAATTTGEGASAVTSSLSSETFTPQSAETNTNIAPQELQEEASLINLWPGEAGATALRQVQFLASKASESTDAMDESQFSLATRRRNRMQSNIQNDKIKTIENFRAKPRRRRRMVSRAGEKSTCSNKGATR